MCADSPLVPFSDSAPRAENCKELARHARKLGPQDSREAKNRSDLGIIGTRCAGRKEDGWRCPINGNGVWKNGRARCADYLECAVTSSRARKSAPPADPS